ncbi:hypothetical protein [Sporolactobacillus shoreae]|nr:hypothetical protein [Sporolactobacillus shoreae]
MAQTGEEERLLQEAKVELLKKIKKAIDNEDQVDLTNYTGAYLTLKNAER